MMVKLPSGSECEVELCGRTIGMGRVKKSPVLGSALTPTVVPPRLLSKNSGSAGLPMGGGGEKRSLRRRGVAGAARRILDTSKSDDRGRRTGSGPTGTISSSSSELSLLISTMLLVLAAVRKLDDSNGLDWLRMLLEDGPASIDLERAELRVDPLAEPTLRSRVIRDGYCAGEADLLAGTEEYALLAIDEALLEGREPATTVGRGSGGSGSVDPDVGVEFGMMIVPFSLGMWLEAMKHS